MRSARAMKWRVVGARGSANCSSPPPLFLITLGDRALLVEAIQGPHLAAPPANFGEFLQLENAVLAHSVFRQAKDTVFFNELQRHHALDDARALMAAHAVWRIYMDQNEISSGLKTGISD